MVIRLLLSIVGAIALASNAAGQTAKEHYMHRSYIELATSSEIPDQQGFDVIELFLDLEADNLSTKISGSATLKMVIVDASYDQITLELISKLQVSSVQIGEMQATFNHADDLIQINSIGLSQGDTIDIKINYSGTPNPASEGIFSGINNETSNAWGNQITYTLSEPFNARVWWPSKQDLTDKIDRTRVHITTSNHLKVGSNGLLVNTTNLSNDRIKYQWETNYPMAYYLVAFAIGEYVEYNNYAKPAALNGDSILVQNYIYNNPETLPYYLENLDRIPAMIELFSELYGLYPFSQEKYGHMMAPFSGGMEHQTMSSMGIFTFGLDAHELGHQWFGDHVTCGTWNDIWINEGFARFSEYLALEFLLGSNQAADVIADDIFDVTSNKGGSVYIPFDEELTDSRIFGYRMSYQKGALLVHMIRNIINNDDVFFGVLKEFLAQYGNSTATGEDFRKVLELQTSIDFFDFYQQWYYGSGYPIYQISWRKLSGDTLDIHVIQSTSDKVALFTTPLEFRLTFESGQTKLIRLIPSENDQHFLVAAQGKVANVKFDPDQWLIKKVRSFYKLDENGNPILSTIDNHGDLVYPNPAHELLNFTQPVRRVVIVNLMGQVMLKQSFDLPQSRLDIKKLQPGTYVIQTEVNGQASSVQFFKR
ncbi:MAG: T9SS type A sorting domain-containing protein [Cyclobacteriaceae bacterium]